MPRKFRRKTATPKKLKLKEKVIDRRREILILQLSILAILFFAFITNAYGARPAYDGVSELERKVWLSGAENFSAIEKDIVKLIQVTPDSSFAHYLLSHLYLRRYSNKPANMNLLKKASELAQQAIDLDPTKDHGYVVVAEVLDIMGQTENAIKMLEYDPTKQVDPSWRTWFMHAKLKSDRLNNETILNLLEKAIQEEDSQIEIISPYVIAILQSEKNLGALNQQLMEWDRKYPSYLFKQSRAMTLAKMNRFTDAHRLYTQTYSRDFNHVHSILNDAVLLYSKLNQPRKASILLRHLLENDASTPQVKSSANAHLGRMLLKKRQYASAGNHFTDAMVQAPNRYELLTFVTQSYRARKDYKPLASFLKNLNVEIPGSAILHALLGETLSEDIGDHDKALKSFAHAIILDPNRSDFYNGMGLAYYRKNSLNRALQLFNHASKIDPDDAIAKYNVACVLSKLDRKQEAIMALKEALSLDPRLQENARTDIDFTNIKETHQFVDMMSKDPNKQSDEEGDSHLPIAH